MLPVLAALPQPLALIGVGASAGLCLYPDRYRSRVCCPTPSGGPGSASTHSPLRSRRHQLAGVPGMA
ncbi:DUF2332 domain-containing protein [Streptomyces sp. BHT-5-2]|uniref:DUF2332 domain-containing protein n=1 Tax=Streptomyces sp. BHT-5-2 TaxID=2866715 RepID=UPI0021B0ADB7|nr:DUF2332 domain-containing protein [Streptomyces sp. BHT-5-2]